MPTKKKNTIKKSPQLSLTFKKKAAPKKRKAPVKKKLTDTQIALIALKKVEKKERAMISKLKRKNKTVKKKLTKIRATTKTRKRRPAKK